MRNVCQASNWSNKTMTAELFYDDAYLRQFDAAITAVDKKDGQLRVALDLSLIHI